MSVDAIAQAVADAVMDFPFIQLDQNAFENAIPISVDYAVMERTA